MKLTQERYQELTDDNAGYCKHCDAIRNENVEPDADGYDCDECGKPEVMGVENALIYEHIEITEEDDEDMPDIISLSDED